MLPGEEWSHCECWWYILTHICQRWRRLVFTSASHLGICLVCTYDTPVADMLAHFPALPLVVDYTDKTHGLTGKGRGGLWCALLPGPECHDRVRRIRLLIHQPYQWSFVTMLFDGTFPRLEYLFIKLQEKGHASTSLKLPSTFQALCLRHLVLTHFGFPLASPMLVTSVHLITLSLNMVLYCPPNDLLEQISFLPQLETLHIASTFSIPEGSSSVPWGQAPPQQMLLDPYVTLSNLHSFVFEGTVTVPT